MMKFIEKMSTTPWRCSWIGLSSQSLGYSADTKKIKNEEVCSTKKQSVCNSSKLQRSTILLMVKTVHNVCITDNKAKQSKAKQKKF